MAGKGNEPRCALCTRPGNFDAGLCPCCVASGRPIRAGIEQAMVVVARQTLNEAEALPVTSARPEDLTFHLTAVSRSLRSILQLLRDDTPPASAEGGVVRIFHLCGNCRTTTDRPAVRTIRRGAVPGWSMIVCPNCYELLGGEIHVDTK
jgi:hypothetical protein